MALKNFAQQNVTRLSFVEEATPGTTPATPSMRIIPIVSSSLDMSKTLITSSALNSNRQKHFSRHGNRQTGGDVATEFAYGTFDPLLKSVMMSESDFTGPVDAPFMIIGTKGNYMTFEEMIAGQATPVYKRFPGSRVNSATFSIQQDAIIAATWNIIGTDMTVATTPLDATPGVGGNELLQNTPFVHKEATISVNGEVLAIVASYEFTINNGITPTFTVGSDIATAHGYNDADVSGTFTAYIENQVLFNYYMNESEVDMSVSMEDRTGNGYRFDMSKVKINSAPQNVGGEGPRQSVFSFEALWNAGDNSTVRITKLLP